MKTFIITYNPLKWPESKIQKLINRLNNGDTVIERWKFGSPKKCKVGDRIFLSRVGVNKPGVIGSGYIASLPRQEPNFEMPEKLSWYVDIQFDYLSPAPDTVVVDHKVLSSILKVSKRTFTPQQSGVSFNGDQKLLEKIWKSYTLQDDGEIPYNKENIFPEVPKKKKVKQKDEKFGEGQVFTVAKIHYINGVVYLAAQKGTTDLQTLADNCAETTKSGKVKHPLDRVRTLARLAKGIGLLTISKDRSVEITTLGKKYYSARANNKWSLSKSQQQLLCNHILSDYYRTKTIYSITTLFRLCKSGYVGMELARQFALEIGKDKAWKSDVTYEGFTKFGLSYIEELGLLEIDDRDLILEDISNERRYQESVNEVEPIQIPKGKLPRSKPREYGNRKKYVSNPRRSRNALEIAGFRCELDQSHTTFINKKSKKQYMEAHHLIPMSKQGAFEYDIDVPENIMSLCPNCHKKIHLSEDIAKRDILKEAYDGRRNQLLERGIDINSKTLFEIYNIAIHKS